MTTNDILSVICQWLNSLGYKAIKGPSDNPAPSGRYISVTLGPTRQHGDVLVPGPVSDAETEPKYKTVMQVASIQLYEVEGDGEWLRDIRNRLQLSDVDDFINSHTPHEPGKDNRFSVWDIGDIVDNSSQDGGYWIRQRTMTFDVQFYDHIAHTAENAPRMASVDFEIETRTTN